MVAKNLGSLRPMHSLPSADPRPGERFSRGAIVNPPRKELRVVYPMKTPPLLLPVSLLLGACVSTPAFSQTLWLDYDFNGSLANAGSAANATLAYYGGAASSSAGSGVSGAGGDSALNNTGAAGMGTGGNSAAGASTSSKSVDFGTLGSFTIAGWYNAETVAGGGAKLFELYGTGTNNVVTLIAESSTRLALSIFGSSSGNNSTSQSGYSTTNGWVFFAVTYNGTTATNNLNFYIGNASSLSAAGARSITATNLALGETGVGVGNGYYNNGNANRPFDGLIDEIAFYGAGADSAAGALSLSQLDALRLASLSGIPEPSSAAALLGGIGLAFAALRRRERRG